VDEISYQRNFFTKVAIDYDITHSEYDKHGAALAWLQGAFEFYGFKSYL